ncbi:histidine phosphatase family protein [Vibrio panuliri]|uniref:Phosphoglycerate mutase n=1 Tax=Vibrio panuliri TaxID=1381081 RepID=A0ABX3F4I3_9VIBR|nr:histidine phosphatase family protein [Vibrio panuliri]KAB1454025.1 histidine phosphatase family protein [Vibrio panuliri]OLQ84438.1 hypothetical protein BIY20_03845 [Vibrio panuliri]
MKLVLLRHGETSWNIERRIHGWLDSPLTPAAIEQINHIQLPTAASFVVWSSDLGRAAHTAQILADKLGTQVRYDVRLRERNFGLLQGEQIDKKPQLKAAWQWYHQRYHKPCNGEFCVEDESVFEHRIRTFLSGLSSGHAQDLVVVVGHGEWLRAALNLINGRVSWHQGDGIIKQAEPIFFDCLPPALSEA